MMPVERRVGFKPYFYFFNVYSCSLTSSSFLLLLILLQEPRVVMMLPLGYGAHQGSQQTMMLTQLAKVFSECSTIASLVEMLHHVLARSQRLCLQSSLGVRAVAMMFIHIFTIGYTYWAWYFLSPFVQLLCSPGIKPQCFCHLKEMWSDLGMEHTS